MADSTYDECFLKGHGECGQFAAKRSNELFKFCEVNESVESHFRTLKIKLPAANDSLASIRTEKGLILDRVSIKEDNIPDNAKICSRHMYCDGVCYHIRRQCAHPKHEELRKRMCQKLKRSVLEQHQFHCREHKKETQCALSSWRAALYNMHKRY